MKPTFIIKCLLVLGFCQMGAAERALLKAGAATSNITTDIGSDIVGGFAPVPSRPVHDDLHARGLVLSIQQRSYAERVQILADKKEPARVPLQVLRIGDIGIGTYACEIFAEIGLEFKRRSAIPHSFMVSLNHGYFGYLPTPRHYELAGYETWPGTKYLETQASVKMMDELLGMAAELKRREAKQ